MGHQAQGGSNTAFVTKLSPEPAKVIITEDELVDTAPCEYQPSGVDEEEPSY